MGHRNQSDSSGKRVQQIPLTSKTAELEYEANE